MTCADLRFSGRPASHDLLVTELILFMIVGRSHVSLNFFDTETLISEPTEPSNASPKYILGRTRKTDSDMSPTSPSKVHNLASILNHSRLWSALVSKGAIHWNLKHALRAQMIGLNILTKSPIWFVVSIVTVGNYDKPWECKVCIAY